MDIYDMNIHESISFAYGTVIRVPGGWIYNVETFDINDKSVNVSACFVRFDNEFQQKKTSEKPIQLTSKAKEREQEGAHAYRLGKTTSDCPYPARSSERVLWLYGWTEAEGLSKIALKKTEQTNKEENAV